MVRYLALVAVVTVACSLPKFRGGPGGGDDDDGPRDAPTDGSGSGHDEDSDGKPDMVDPCPGDDSAASNLDSDGDGVGDLCDPAPNISGDRKVLYTFQQDTGNLVAFGTPVTLEDDAISFGNTTTVGALETLWLPDQWTRRVRIEIGYEVGAYGLQDGTHNYNELALHVGNNGAADDLSGLACNLERLAVQSTVHHYIEMIPGSELASTQPDPSYPLSGSHGKLILENAGELSCVSARDGAAPLLVMFNTGFAVGRVGVSAYQLRVRLKYIFVSGL